MPDRTVSLLLVEDDSVDAEAVIRGLRRLRIANPIVRARDGIEALDILRGTNGRGPIDRPFLILLDLNLPRMSGIEFLDELRGDPEIRDSLVFVLTTSSAQKDKAAAYSHHVAGYLVKSRAGDDFVNVLDLVDHFWRYVEFPEETDDI